jgi:hypothetical protein
LCLDRKSFRSVDSFGFKSNSMNHVSGPVEQFTFEESLGNRLRSPDALRDPALLLARKYRVPNKIIMNFVWHCSRSPTFAATWRQWGKTLESLVVNTYRPRDSQKQTKATKGKE